MKFSFSGGMAVFGCVWKYFSLLAVVFGLGAGWDAG
jgi:hypothetical protein